MWTNRTRLEHNTLNSQNTGRNNRKSKAKLDLPNETCNGTVDNISLKLSLKCNGEEKVINFNNNFEYNMQIKILKKKAEKITLQNEYSIFLNIIKPCGSTKFSGKFELHTVEQISQFPSINLIFFAIKSFSNKLQTLLVLLQTVFHSVGDSISIEGSH